MCFLSGKPVEKKTKKGQPGIQAGLPGGPSLDTGREWETDMCHALCNDCPACCAGYLCPWCCGCHMRCQVLQNEMHNYKCCQGYGVGCIKAETISKVCGCCEGKGEQDKEGGCPKLGNCCEAIFCIGCHVSSSKNYLQMERQIETDPCDNRLIALANCLQILACVCQILAIFCSELRELADCISFIADCVFYMVIGCMIGQMHLELKRHPTKNDYEAISNQPKF